jgi:hypothetical protein
VESVSDSPIPLQPERQQTESESGNRADNNQQNTHRRMAHDDGGDWGIVIGLALVPFVWLGCLYGWLKLNWWLHVRWLARKWPNV